MSHGKSDQTISTVFGPGGWFSIHLLAINAKTAQEKDHFIRFMNLFCQNFKCKECQGHCSEYLKTNPPETYLNKDVYINEKYGTIPGVFKWSWEFHNAVNKRLHKPEMSFESAYKYYLPGSSEGVCTAGCGETAAAPAVLPKAPAPIQYQPRIQPSFQQSSYPFVPRVSYSTDRILETSPDQVFMRTADSLGFRSMSRPLSGRQYPRINSIY